MSSRFRTRWGRGVIATAVLALACTLSPAAGADDVTQDDIDRAKQAEASTSTSVANLEAQLSQLTADSDAATIEAQASNETYLEALDELDTATQDAQTAQGNADTAASNTATAREDLGATVVQIYQDGGNALDALTPYLTSDSLGDLADKDVALQRAGERSDAEVQNVEALQAVADTLQDLADQKKSEKQTAADTAEQAKQDADTKAADAQQQVADAQVQRATLIEQLATQRNTTVGLETQRQAQLEAAQKAKEEAEAKAAAEAAAQAAAQAQAEAQAQADAAASQAAQEEAASSSGSEEYSGSGGYSGSSESSYSDSSGSADPVSYSGSGGASAAISAAYSYTGVPYVWAGESYGGVDCSGLTMLAWRAAGVYLTHSSRVQYGQGSQVPLASAQPGDLVFWSSNGTQSGIYHVAMYLGGGQMIEAPTFGYTVRVTSMRYAGTMPYAVRL